MNKNRLAEAISDRKNLRLIFKSLRMSVQMQRLSLSDYQKCFSDRIKNNSS